MTHGEKQTVFSIGNSRLFKADTRRNEIQNAIDELVVSWTLGTGPKVELVNNMLDTAISGLKDGQTLIVHTDVSLTTAGLVG